MWGNLLHLSMNMWRDAELPDEYVETFLKEYGQINFHRQASENTDLRSFVKSGLTVKDTLSFDDDVWNEILEKMRTIGMNAVLIDLGDGVRYKSHPEIAVSDAWTVDRLKKEIKKIRAMGMEPLPKLNFSTAHDAWMKEYSRSVSTPRYYQVCSDLIREVIKIFDGSRLFHIGMDEETYNHQRYYEYAVVRHNELWWHDLMFYINEVEKHKVQAWMWSDYIWHRPEVFIRKMPRSVLQSNWYYGTAFSESEFTAKGETLEEMRVYPESFKILSQHGYDQIPCGSNWQYAENFTKLAGFCANAIKEKKTLSGFLMAPWAATTKAFRGYHIEALEKVRETKEIYQSHS